MKSLLRVLSYLKPYKKAVSFTLGFAILTTLLDLIPPWIVKVIIESCLWNSIQIKTACEIVRDAKAQFVKTSTGFSKHGASVEHVKLIRETVGDIFGVKASGGNKSFQDAVAMIQPGANRIGTSSGVEIMNVNNAS